MLTIRVLQPADDLVALNKTLVNPWYKEIDGIMEVTPWEDLTPKERYMHGGPWNDPECLKIHLDSFLQFGSILVAIDDETNELIGELEYHIIDSEIHLDWIMTRPDWRRYGVASALLQEMQNRHPNISQIRTESESEAQEFYTQLNFVEDPKFVNSYTREHSKFTDNIVWNTEYVTPKYIVGMGENTYPYTLHLLRTQPLIAEVFGEENPVHVAKVQITDKTLTVISRRFLGFDDTFTVLFGAESELTEEDILAVNKYIINGDFKFYLQTKRTLQLPNWQITSRSKQLLKQLF